MSNVVFVTGGARSGKSSFAEARARVHGDQVLYIATARAFDEEMKERIAKHRRQRPASWETYEGVSGFGAQLKGRTGAVLLDCVTLLVTDLMMDSGADWDHPTSEQIQAAERAVLEAVDGLVEAARAEDLELILVSNELGMGLVPAYAFGRVFRDVAGRVNQHLAALADEAYFLVAGIPLQLKGGAR